LSTRKREKTTQINRLLGYLIMKDLLHANYAHIFEPELMQEIIDVGIIKEVSEGELLMDIGQYISAMPLLISGAIKILREDAEGNELLLYFLEKVIRVHLPYLLTAVNVKVRLERLQN